jgi:hypothetical protein
MEYSSPSRIDKRKGKDKFMLCPFLFLFPSSIHFIHASTAKLIPHSYENVACDFASARDVRAKLVTLIQYVIETVQNSKPHM